MRNLIAFMLRAHRLPIKPMTDSVNSDFELSSSLTALTRTHRSKNKQSGTVSKKRRRRCLFSDSAACEDQHSDMSRARSLAETCSTPSNSGSPDKGTSAKDWSVCFPLAKPPKLLELFCDQEDEVHIDCDASDILRYYFSQLVSCHPSQAAL